MTRFIVLIISILYICSSCNRRGAGFTDKDQKHRESLQLREKAQSVLYSNPDSALLYVDSAIRLLAASDLTDTAVMDVMLLKANALLGKGASDSAFKLVEDLRLKAARSSNAVAQALFALKLGKIAFALYEYSLASKYLKEAIQLYEKMPAQGELGEAYRVYGYILLQQANYMQSQRYLLKAFDLFKTRNDQSKLSMVSLAIGNNYYATGNRSKELAYSRMALTAARQAYDTAQLTNVLINLGVFYRTEYPDSALYYYKKAISLDLTGAISRSTVVAKYNIANLYFDKKEYQKAKTEYFNLLQICRTAGYYDGIVRIYSGLALLDESLGDYKEPIVYLNQARHLADSIGDIPLRITVMEQLMDGQKMAGNFREALNLTTQIHALKDSVLVQDKQDNLHELDMVYQSEKRDQENKSLTSKVLYQESHLKTRLILILLLTLATIIMAIALVIGYRWNQQRNLAYGILIEKLKAEDENSKIIPMAQGTPETELGIDLTAKPPQHIMDEIDQYFREDKPYLDPKLRIEEVSSILNISPRVITILLKEFKNINFASYVNQYRIERSKELMNDIDYKNYKVEAIAIESGFGTRQSFYNAFEQQIGMKPSFYHKYILKKSGSV